ncbi:amidase [Algihabitans albus]|uniref:amidase n=1 Tax=Algihabitans albus TaxID=2164067 RepID=UPI0035CF5D14
MTKDVRSTSSTQPPEDAPLSTEASGAFGRATACWTEIDRQEAELRAFVACENTGSEPPAGPLHGLPYAAKDLFDVAGRAPTWGLRQPPAGRAQPQRTAVAVRRLEDAGAIRLGYTRMTPLAYQPSGYNALQGTPVNPRDPDFAPGGSSSGSAVAVAAGMADVALGTDTAGSLRIPASCCGVAAWKPTHGAVPAAGAMPLAPSLDSIGLLATRVGALEAVAAVLAPQLDWSAATLSDSVAVAADVLDASEAPVREAVESSLQRLLRRGTRLHPITVLPQVEQLGTQALRILQAEAARCHATLIDSGTLDPALVQRLVKGWSIAEQEVAMLLAGRPESAKRLAEALPDDTTILALPVMPCRTPPMVETDPASERFSPRRLYEMSAFTRFVNLLGWPAVAVTVGQDDRGLPVALQLVGPAGSDARLLALAAQIEGVA